jgi:hypothetical protein
MLKSFKYQESALKVKFQREINQAIYEYFSAILNLSDCGKNLFGSPLSTFQVNDHKYGHLFQNPQVSFKVPQFL